MATYSSNDKLTSGCETDRYQTHAPRMYGAWSFHSGEKDGESSKDHGETTDDVQGELIMDEGSCEAVFPEGEHPYALGEKGRFAVVQPLEYGVYVSLREYFQKPDEHGIVRWVPTKKGIHLRLGEWKELVRKIGEIDEKAGETEEKYKLKMRKLESRFTKRKCNVLRHPSDRAETSKRIRPTPMPLK